MYCKYHFVHDVSSKTLGSTHSSSERWKMYYIIYLMNFIYLMNLRHPETIPFLMFLSKNNLKHELCNGIEYIGARSCKPNCNYNMCNILQVLGNSIWTPHTPCGRFKKPLVQRECEFQVDKLIWHFWTQHLLPLWWII